MKLAKKDVLQLSELDSLIMSEIEKIGILKANQLAVLLSTSRQAVAYRLKVLQKRGFLKYVKGIGWQIGTYWKKQSEEQVGSGFEVIVGLDKIVERTPGTHDGSGQRQRCLSRAAACSSRSGKLVWDLRRSRCVRGSK
jgi:DNA-binding GntR family transcriptional regulator